MLLFNWYEPVLTFHFLCVAVYEMLQVWACLEFLALKEAENYWWGSVFVYMTCKEYEAEIKISEDKPNGFFTLTLWKEWLITVVRFCVFAAVVCTDQMFYSDSDKELDDEALLHSKNISMICFVQNVLDCYHILQHHLV